MRHFTKQNAHFYQLKSLESRSKNTARRIARLAIADHISITASHSPSYVEERLVNLRSMLLKMDLVIKKCRDARRMKELCIAQKFLTEQERALVRPVAAPAPEKRGPESI